MMARDMQRAPGPKQTSTRDCPTLLSASSSLAALYQSSPMARTPSTSPLTTLSPSPRPLSPAPDEDEREDEREGEREFSPLLPHNTSGPKPGPPDPAPDEEEGELSLLSSLATLSLTLRSCSLGPAPHEEATPHPHPSSPAPDEEGALSSGSLSSLGSTPEPPDAPLEEGEFNVDKIIRGTKTRFLVKWEDEKAKPSWIQRDWTNLELLHDWHKQEKEMKKEKL